MQNFSIIGPSLELFLTKKLYDDYHFYEKQGPDQN